MVRDCVTHLAPNMICSRIGLRRTAVWRRRDDQGVRESGAVEGDVLLR